MEKTYYIFQKNKVVYKKSDGVPLPFDRRQRDAFCPENSLIVSQRPLSADGIDTVELPDDLLLPADYDLVPLRRLLGWVDDHLFSQWGKASQLLHWYRSNRYCGSCGTPTVAHPNEQARLCPNCSAHLYPAISPCVIVLIHQGNEILLARSPRFPGKMYSTLAGFIESGESAEQTVHREIYEEVRIKVKNIEYFKSQPWPFPGQLMLGFFAEYDSGEIRVDGVEICDAGWYTFDNLPEIPAPGTIAGQLIRHHILAFSRSNTPAESSLPSDFR